MQRKGISFIRPGDIAEKVDKLGTQTLDLKILTLPKNLHLIYFDHQVYSIIIATTSSKERNNPGANPNPEGSNLVLKRGIF